MLSWIRKYSRSWFIFMIIGLIALVFILWGVGDMKSPAFREVAEVNGIPILHSAYTRQYNETLKQYQERAKGELTEEALKAMHLKEQVLNRLIDETLLLQAGQRLGIRVSVPELQEQIRSYSFFQEDGQFNQRSYEMALARAHLTPGGFEEQERQRLLLNKIVQAVTSFAKVSDVELQEFFRLSREAVNVRYLAVSPAPFVSRQHPSEAEVADYYQKHQEQFRTPDRARVRYLLFKPADYQEQVRPTPAEVASYVQDHSEEFTRPLVIRARELVLALPPKAGAAERKKVEQQAQDLLRQARGRADFARLVQLHSQDKAARDKGGELGEVKRGQHSPEWDRVAFSLKKGEVGLASTPQGFHLIRLEEVRETESLPEAEAHPQAMLRLKEEQSRRLAQEKASLARGELAGRQPLAAVAQKYGLRLQETPFLTLVEPVPDLGPQPRFNQAALSLKPQEISRVVDLSAGYAVLQGWEQQEAKVPPLDQIKEKVRLAVSRQLAQKQAEQEAERLAKRLLKGDPLPQVAAQAGLPLQDSGFFTRFQGFANQPQAEALTSAAFLLSPQNLYPPQPLLWQDKYYLLVFQARRTPSPEEFQKERDKLKAEYLEHKRGVIFAAWLAAERQGAKIKIYEIPG